jgi:oligopeptide/dipeptide ABC transporter ATP-binding protein
LLEGRPLGDWLNRDARALRQRMQMVFQDPLDSLDPRQTIRESVAEPLRILPLARRQRHWRVAQALEEVHLPLEVANAYPHELSGGQRQRVGIARAMIGRPSFVLCDEAVSSLDLSIRMQVLQLLLRMQRERAVAYGFISHDLGVVRAVSHQVAVMYLGKIVESGPVEDVLASPQHPYTEALIAAVPAPDPEKLIRVQLLAGEPPSPRAVPSGCRFRTRCPIARDRCAAEEPPLVEKSPGRLLACHFRP